jgi:hypothetical protein
LTDKGIYTAEEFQALFIEHAINFKNRVHRRNLMETSHETAPANL